jgi:peroxiredoxin (alkyl hydroperoxide reductase subunit C)
MTLVGRQAPDFALEGVRAGEFVDVALREQRGQWVVLFFYPLDFTFVCPTEIREFSKRGAEFAEVNAQVLAVSVDSKYAHLAWQREIGPITYPMLADITKRVSREYGVLIEDEGVALRGLFIIDPDGTVRYELVHDLSVGRSVGETLRVLKALQTGELCPVDWQPGMETLGAA